ncbi:hypothetical protein AB0I53_48910 [Saccharopolyspora sp. NPDC050389]|uniref:hypothetical protein n=1 Tax=Saccharopolyspora sp. NPDC050389 TaxID=3155516 RepID=UPI0033C227E2
MTSEERKELFRQYLPKPEDVDPEVRKRTDEAIRRIEEKKARGEVLKSWSKDDTPIGLDSNFEPFPVTGPDQDEGRTDDRTRQ